MSPPLSPEYRFLLACVRTLIRENPADALEGIAREGLDWTCLAENAGLHGIAPLVYKKIKPHAETLRAAEGAVRTLRHAYLFAEARNDALLRELTRLLHALAQRGVEAIPLKGAWLARQFYPEPALRPMGDIDLLLRREDVAVFLDVAARLGYPASQQTIGAQDPGREPGHLPSLIGHETNTTLEPHWELGPEYRGTLLDSRLLWDGARRVLWEDVQVPGLAPEKLLLWQCLHLADKHGYIANGIRDIVDIALIISLAGSSFRWTMFWEVVREQGWTAEVAVPIALARRLLEAPMHEPSPRWLRLPSRLVDCAEVCVLCAPMLRPYLQPTARKEIRRGYVHFVRKMALAPPEALSIPYRLGSWRRRRWHDYSWLASYVRFRLDVIRKKGLRRTPR